MQNNEKMIFFEKWCTRCKHEATNENKEPCEECISSPVNENSRKPIKFEENENDKKKERDCK